MAVHAIRLDPVPGGWAVSGAVSIANSKAPTADAVKALAAIGKAGPHDVVRVNWPGSHFTANVGAVLSYRPSLASQAVDRAGKIHHHLGERH
jgi:hypothetical protein